MNSSDQAGPDYSMLSRRWSGIKLITSQMAMEIARIVHRELEGQANLDCNEPLSVVDDGDSWVVSGAKSIEYDPSNPVLEGSLKMRISQFDAQILSYVLALTMPRPAAAGPNTDQH